MENPIELDDLGVPLFQETTIYVTGITQPFSPQNMLNCQARGSGLTCVNAAARAR